MLSLPCSLFGSLLDPPLRASLDRVYVLLLLTVLCSNDGFAQFAPYQFAHLLQTAKSLWSTQSHMQRPRRSCAVLLLLATVLRIDARHDPAPHTIATQLAALKHPGGPQQHLIDETQVLRTKQAIAAGGAAQFHAPATAPGLPDETVRPAERVYWCSSHDGMHTAVHG